MLPQPSHDGTASNKRTCILGGIDLTPERDVVISAFRDRLVDWITCSERARAVPHAYINECPSEELKQLPAGYWKFTEFDSHLLQRPLAVITERESGDGRRYLVDIATQELINWPVLPMKRRSSRQTARVVRGSVRIEQPWFSCGVYDTIAAWTPLISIADPSQPQRSVLFWRESDRACFKLSSEFGYCSLPHNQFSYLLSRYRGNGIVSEAGLLMALSNEGHSEEACRELIKPLVMIFGGMSPLRQYHYFTYLCRFEGKPYDFPEDGTDYVTQESPTVIEAPAAAPAMNPDNERSAVRLRVYKPSPPVPIVTQAILSDLNKFARSCGKPGVVRATTDHAVIEVQRTAITRQRMTQAAMNFDHRTQPRVGAFVKKEFYSQHKDPRNISAVEPDHNLDGFRFLLPLKDVLKTFRWYGPGKDPDGVLQQLNDAIYPAGKLPEGVELVRCQNGAPVLLECDFSRFDGSQTQPVRELAFRFMHYFIADSEKHEFVDMINTHFAAICTNANGERYDHLGSMLSGAWCTTDGNTILQAFVIYRALTAIGLCPAAAVRNIGVCFGDDGILRQLRGPQGLLSEALVKSARDLHLTMEVIVRDEGISGYLSRYYEFGPDRIEASCPDLARLLPKFQFSVSNCRDPLEMFQKKYSSLLLLVGDTTPVLSPYLQNWFAFRGLRPSLILEGPDLPYWLQVIEETGLSPVPFIPSSQRLGQWVVDECAKALSVTPESITRLDAAIRSSTSLEEMRTYFLRRDPAGVPANVRVSYRTETGRKVEVLPRKPAKKSGPLISAEDNAREANPEPVLSG